MTTPAAPPISDELRLRALRWILCFGFAAGFVASRPLWLTARAYPLTPLLGWPSLPPPLDRVCFALLFPLLAGVAAARRFVPWLVAFLVVVAWLALGDQSRWHPWFYWYSFMMVAVLVAARRPEQAPAALAACRLVLIGSYVWAGAQKLNVTFFYSLFPWMLSAFIKAPQNSPLWSNLAFAVPVIEAAAGVALCTARFRRYGVLMAAGMHLTILLLLGPLGHAVNPNVWPWNVCLVALLFALFWREPVPAVELLRPRRPLHAVALLLFLALPLLTFFDVWDAYPGFSLYSGSMRAAYIQLDERSLGALPADLQPFVDEKSRLLASKWASGVVKTPDYAEPRIYHRLRDYVCARLPAGTAAELVIMSKPDRWDPLESTCRHASLSIL